MDHPVGAFEGVDPVTGLSDISLEQPDPSRNMRQVSRAPGGIIVYCGDLVAVDQQPVNDMATNKPGGASYYRLRQNLPLVELLECVRD